MPHKREAAWREEIRALEQCNQRRVLRTVNARDAAWIEIAGTTYLNLASNDYLGLSTHPKVTAAASEAALRYSAGSGASRLVSGNLELYAQLESRLAEIKGTEAALVFPSGYHANLGLISALAGPGDAIVMDRLAHASLVDAARLSRARIKVFPHNDANALDRILSRTAMDKKIVLAESVYSMDGDLAPAEALAEVCEKHEALLIVDDAHGFGVIGETGRGVQEILPRRYSGLIVMGTLSKALGALGGYVAGSRILADYLINRARTFIYTTALPPSILASALASLEVLFGSAEGPALLERLQVNREVLARGLKNLGYPVEEPGSAIFPVIVGEDDRALHLAQMLMEQGFFAPAIRPPTVPKGAARIRISLSARHSPDDLERFLAALPPCAR
jgi:8-amino-7-oxononanoate synthase